MRLSANYGRVGLFILLAVSILMWAASGGASAVEPAPVGHEQPNAANVPPSVLRQENALVARDTKLDKELTICRGC